MLTGRHWHKLETTVAVGHLLIAAVKINIDTGRGRLARLPDTIPVFIVKYLPQHGTIAGFTGIAAETLEKAGIEQSELDWLIPHQANIRIIQATAKRLDLPMDKVILTVQDHGNTSAASVPMALDVGIRDGRVKKGQLVLMEAFGGGFTWGSVLMRL